MIRFFSLVICLFSICSTYAEDVFVSRFPTNGANCYLDGGVVYWFGKKSGLDQDLNEPWHIGFRVGLGYHHPQDNFEVGAEFTQYRTTDEQRSHFPKEKWHLKYSLLDLDFSTLWFASSWCALKPFFGARGVFIHQDLDIDSNPQLFMEQKSHYKAGGIVLGSDLQFKLYKGLVLYGNIAGSIVDGSQHKEMKRFKEQTLTYPREVTLCETKGYVNNVSESLHLKGGLQYIFPLYLKEAFLTLSAYYEWTRWYNLNSFIPSRIEGSRIGNGHLTLQGMTFTARADF